MSNHAPGIKSLRRIDLGRIFNPTTPGPPPNRDRSESAAGQQDFVFRPPEFKMDIIRLPTLTFSFRASASASSASDEWKMDCFPLSDGKVMCVDQSGRGFLFDANSREVATVPYLCKSKVMPISLSIPQADVDQDYRNYDWGSKLFLMERMPKLEVNCSTQQSDQFEAFIYRKRIEHMGLKSWHHHLLPPPPFVHETFNCDSRPEITSYAVIDGGSHICISVEGAGTYCMHTVSHTWNRVGEWTLPFHGKIEYVPELKLWFGISTDSGHLAAADLSAMDSQPQLVGTWKELDPPAGWKECKDSQFVSLGSGRFCIARFFQTKTVDVHFGDELLKENFTVITGVEVVNGDSSNNAKVELQMIPHKLSRVNSTTIEALF
ncbi:hypothetical protein PR202_gb21652 [Eleusine coracana subsp. coracana]|uniref:Uncharacterized protein n=1 Tax=Eleusine coracana subsp. coracana TaxID=191504 RepID=A0AAV5FBM4_ELECO|nr:hypothetical protein PR202_gb21652 [Eleusine coracana subsp. coracana]